MCRPSIGVVPFCRLPAASLAGCTWEFYVEGDPEVLTNPDKASAKLALALGNDAARSQDWKTAVTQYTEAIRLDPSRAMAYSNRGHCRNAQGNYDKALADLNKAIELDPNLPLAYGNRAMAWNAMEKYDRVVEDLASLLRIKPDDAQVLYDRGSAWYKLGEREKAMADFKKAAEINPDFAWSHNDLAWLLATNPDPEQRDGAKAVAHATRACKLTGGEDWSCLGTLAAAFAEDGQWKAAIQCQEAAIRLAGEDDRPRLNERLQLYKSEQPYYEPTNRKQADLGRT